MTCGGVNEGCRAQDSELDVDTSGTPSASDGGYVNGACWHRNDATHCGSEGNLVLVGGVSRCSELRNVDVVETYP